MGEWGEKRSNLDKSSSKNVVHLPLSVFHRKVVNQLSKEAGKAKQNKQNKHLPDWTVTSFLGVTNPSKYNIKCLTVSRTASLLPFTDSLSLLKGWTQWFVKDDLVMVMESTVLHVTPKPPTGAHLSWDLVDCKGIEREEHYSPITGSVHSVLPPLWAHTAC